MKQLGPLLILLMFFSSCSHSQELKINEIQNIANEILISKNFHVNINTVLPIIDEIQVVVLDLPYREFPSIILITKDSKTNKWKRIFECLSPGIQDNPSGLLDWHVKGSGVDFQTDSITIYSFHSRVVTNFVESIIKDKGGVIIPYQNFIHMHTADSLKSTTFSPYTIDKTCYYDFANILMENKYKNYQANDCMMFDSPKILKCSFTKVNNKYSIRAITNNSQIWLYTFDGIDSNYMYLLNKKIEVTNSR
jgi:hypothetical protein